jgi:hypothetical protein
MNKPATKVKSPVMVRIEDWNLNEFAQLRKI